jgi:rRNA biogenesis protein RRP5
LIPQSIVDGEIKKIEAFGVFIQIENSDIRGLCHKSELSDRPVIDITKIYEVGDRVQAFILKTDVANKKVSLSLKSSYFEALSELSDEEVISHSNELAEEDDMIIDTSFEADATMSIKAPLTLEGFTWDSSTIELRNSVRDSEEESESEDDDIQQKRNRRSTKREREEKEKSIAAKEKSLLDSSAAPEMPEDFERLLIGSPNNSFIWIKYMAFQLELAETEKARKIADRALATISFREEQEKLNILVAYLNLENKFGDKESLQNVFDKACQISDPKKVHIQLVRIYDRNDQHEVVLI